MRPPGLQYLYLQKPLSLLLLIAALSTLPWLGMGEYYTKGEAREASVAVSMLQGEWILPEVYADEFAYKPPLHHWITTVFSSPCGKVTPFTSRLPSALAFIWMLGISFVFLGQHIKKGQAAFIASLLMLCSFELHRAAMTSRVDMLLTACMVAGLLGLYRWIENRDLRGFPWTVVLALAGAALTKGPVGVLLPLLVGGLFALVLNKKIWKVFSKLTAVALLALLPLFIWYYLAYIKEGEELVDLMWAENVGRLLGLQKLDINYQLGHEFPRYYNLLYLLGGFAPWSLLLLLFAFTARYKGSINRAWQWLKNWRELERAQLFSWIVALVIVGFYCIPISRRSVYLMPAYPFIALLLAQFTLFISDYRERLLRWFSTFLLVLTATILLLSALSWFNLVPWERLATLVSTRHKTQFDIVSIGLGLSKHSLLYAVVWLVFAYTWVALVYALIKKNKLKILYTSFALFIVGQLFLDAVPLPAFKNRSSIKPFIHSLQQKYPLEKGRVYVMNNLLKYGNLYGPNFYLGNIFLNFDTERPSEGYLFSFPANMKKMQTQYNKAYTFTLLEESPNAYNDVKHRVQLYKIEKLPEETKDAPTAE